MSTPADRCDVAYKWALREGARGSAMNQTGGTTSFNTPMIYPPGVSHTSRPRVRGRPRAETRDRPDSGWCETAPVTVEAAMRARTRPAILRAHNGEFYEDGYTWGSWNQPIRDIPIGDGREVLDYFDTHATPAARCRATNPLVRYCPQPGAPAPGRV